MSQLGRPRTTRRRGSSRLALLLVCFGIVVGGAWLWNTRFSAPATNQPLIRATASIVVAAPRPTPTPEPYLNQKVPKWAQSKVIHRVHVRPGDKVFALTFDDGPWPEYTEQVLSILDQFHIKATFFMVGQEVQRRPKIARLVRDAGHAIGNHSWNHPIRPRDAVQQVRHTDAILKKTLGFQPTFFRPPYGALNNGMAKQAMKEKEAVLIWSADSNDWRRPGSATIANRIIRQASPGGISLMHDGGGNRSQTLVALPEVISTLQARGYRFVTIPELLKLRYVAPPKPATKKKAKKSKKTRAKKPMVKRTATPAPMRTRAPGVPNAKPPVRHTPTPEVRVSKTPAPKIPVPTSPSPHRTGTATKSIRL